MGSGENYLESLSDKASEYQDNLQFTRFKYKKELKSNSIKTLKNYLLCLKKFVI